MNGPAMGVVRPYVTRLAAGPWPRLRPVLEDAVSTVEERLGARGRIIGDHPIELIWGLRSPLTILRETRAYHAWQVSPTVVVQAEGPPLAAPVASRPEEAAAREGVPPPMRLATVERRIETRVVTGALAALTDSARQPIAVPAPVAVLAGGSRLQSAPTRAWDRPGPNQAGVAPPEMSVARPPRSPAVAAVAPVGAPPVAAGSVPRPATLGATPSGVSALPIERITTEVVRALDSRLIAWRERMGRP